MPICHSHNLSARSLERERPFGLRLRLPAGDTFESVLGRDWSALRWFSSESQRDRALVEITGKHPFSRVGDQPTCVVERVVRDADGNIVSEEQAAAG